MPKCCAIPECKKSEGKAEGYYKFPFQDKVRLRQWLANMNLENLVAIKNQHLCSQHFKPSCFQVKSGVRLLKPDAVPTIFPFTGGGSVKKHAAKVKIIHLTPTPKPDMEFVSLPLSGVDILPLSGVVETDTVAIAMDPGFSPGQVYIEADSMVNDIVMPSTVAGAVNLVPLVHFVESFDGLSLALTPQAQGLSSITLPFSLTGDHRSQDISLSQPVSFITEEQIASTSLQHDLYGSEDVLSPHEEVPTMIEVADDGTLLIKDVCIDPFSDCGLHAGAAEMSAAELVSYLETMQTATVVPSLSCPLPPLMPSSETVLSTSITAPISSTVPIVSKHATVVPEFFVEHERGEPGDGIEVPESLTTPELLTIASDLQKKVKALQQRNRRQTSKLEILEGVVEQLKKENIISEEKLSFMEVACVESDTGLAETNTFTIVCQEDEQTLLYALQLDNETQTLLLRSSDYDQVVSV